tara:strand:- start:1290 stop:1625 length:336 start_codon:yes stop_codon:yes gene_type:complete
MTTRFGRVLQAGAEVTQSQDRAQELSDFVEKCPLLDGQLIEDIGILARSGGIQRDTVVPHSLGRDYRGFIIVNTNTSSPPFESSTLNTTKSKTLLLTTLNSSAHTVSLWIF